MLRIGSHLLAAAIALAATVAAADTVYLKNEDRITGHIANKDGDTLTVHTDYAGKLKIRWQDVEQINSDEPVTVLLDDDTETHETQLGGDPSKVPLDRVAYVNPTFGQAGKGIDYSGRVTLASTVTHGNSETERYYADVELGGRSKHRRFALGGNGTKASDRGVSTASNYRIFGDHDWFVDKKKFGYLRTSLERDRFRDLNQRSAVGGGYGYQLIETENTMLSLKGGLDYLIIDRIVGTDKKTIALGWGVRYSQWLLWHRAQVFHDQEGFYGLEEAGLVLRARSGVRVPILNGLNLTAQFNFDYDSDPTPGRKKADSTWLVGLGYVW